MAPNNQPPADERLAQLLRAAALETNSDKLLQLYREMARLNEEKSTEQKPSPNKLTRENDTLSRDNSSR